MISLQQVGKKYQNSKKQITTNAQKIRQKLDQIIQTQTIKALKIQNYKVSEIHKNQQAIQQKIRKNYQMINQIRRSIGNWTQIYESLNNSLKKAGDLAHYADYVQQQIQEIAQILFKKQKQSLKNQENLQKQQMQSDKNKGIYEQNSENENKKQFINQQSKQEVQQIGKEHPLEQMQENKYQ